MLTIKEKGLLLNIITHCKKVESKMSNLSRKDFDNDEDIREIICFNIFQIGELAKNFEPNFIKEYSGVPWKDIKGMRDIIGHGYGTINLDDVWNTALNDVSPLREYCEEIVSKNN